MDELLIDPTFAQLVEAAIRATEAANAPVERRKVNKTRRTWSNTLGPLRKQREGVQAWSGGSSPPAALVRLAWWTDRLGRQHWRVQGRQESWKERTTSTPGGGLAWTYPEHALLRKAEGKVDVVLACPGCGLAGTPDELGWMGRCCGPCHDRALEGGPPPPMLAQAGPWQHWETCVSRYTRDGRLLATRGRQVIGWCLRTGQLLPADALPPMAHAIGEDGSVALWRWEGFELGVLLANGEERTVHLPPGARTLGPASRLVFSPTGRSLLVLGRLPCLFDLTSDPPTCRPLEALQGAALGVFVGDERVHALTTDGVILSCYLPAGGSVEQVDPPALGASGNDPTDQGIACSPDGAWVAVRHHYQGVRLLHWPTRSWGGLNWAAPLLGRPEMAFTPDGRWLRVSSEDHLALAELSTRRQVHLRPGGQEGGFTATAVSPDGAILAVVGRNGRLRFFPWPLVGG